MSYYAQRIRKTSEELYKKEYLTSHLVKAKKFIDRHFAERLDLEKISNEAHLSKFHFVRLFKTHYGRTPYQYLIAVRMSKAKRMLSTGSSVTDVCISVGFESIPSFTRIFKKITGTTPGRFQQLKRKSNFG